MGEHILTFQLNGRVDSSNSTQVQQEIEAAIAQGGYTGIILDGMQLDYISSAGLRVVLSLKKKYHDLKVINASRDVYDIFEMTGFVNMLDVSRALREISINGLEMIGAGTCGRVYRLDQETIIKVFNPGFNLEKITKEQNSARTAFISGIETAISYDVVKVGDCFGIVYEMIDADSVRNCIVKAPDRLEYFAGVYARFLKKMHSTEFSGEMLPRIKDSWIPSVDFMGKYFDEKEKVMVKNMLNSIPDRDTFIHGDFNLGNLMYSNGKAILIDMADSSIGHPVFDLLGVYLSFVMLPNYMPGEMLHKITGYPGEYNARLWNTFCSEYFGVTDEDGRAAIADEIRPFSAFRVLHASLTVPVFPEKMLKECKEILMKEAGKENERSFSF